LGGGRCAPLKEFWEYLSEKKKKKKEKEKREISTRNA